MRAVWCDVVRRGVVDLVDLGAWADVSRVCVFARRFGEDERVTEAFQKDLWR